MRTAVTGTGTVGPVATGRTTVGAGGGVLPDGRLEEEPGGTAGVDRIGTTGSDVRAWAGAAAGGGATADVLADGAAVDDATVESSTGDGWAGDPPDVDGTPELPDDVTCVDGAPEVPDGGTDVDGDAPATKGCGAIGAGTTGDGAFGDVVTVDGITVVGATVVKGTVGEAVGDGVTAAGVTHDWAAMLVEALGETDGWAAAGGRPGCVPGGRVEGSTDAPATSTGADASGDPAVGPAATVGAGRLGDAGMRTSPEGLGEAGG